MLAICAVNNIQFVLITLCVVVIKIISGVIVRRFDVPQVTISGLINSLYFNKYY